MIEPLSQEEINKLKALEEFSTEQLRALATGERLTLGLYAQAKEMLGHSPVITLEKELQELMTKVFLMFTILERKGFISIDEMYQMRDTLEEEGTRNEKRKTKTSTSARKLGSKKKKN